MTQAPQHTGSPSLTVALGEYDIGWQNPPLSLERAGSLSKEARAAGARLLALPEMSITGFTMEAEKFAEPANGPSIRSLSRLARENGLWLIAGAPMRDADAYVNSALVFNPAGEVAASYQKQRLFNYAKETEVYTAGSEPCVVEIDDVSLGVFICFDLRFPELFREVRGDVDAFVVIANWPSTRQRHWEVLTQARAIENQCYMIAVNRTGAGGGLDYVGGSVAYDPWGVRCDRQSEGGIRIAEISASEVRRTRESFPLVNAADYAPTTRRAR